MSWTVELLSENVKMYSRKLTNKKVNNLLWKLRRIRDGLSFSNSWKSKETRGKSIPSHSPILKSTFLVGMGLRLGVASTLVSLAILEVWRMTGHSLFFLKLLFSCVSYELSVNTSVDCAPQTCSFWQLEHWNTGCRTFCKVPYQGLPCKYTLMDLRIYVLWLKDLFLELQWKLFIMDTLGPAISGSFLLLYICFPLSEVKMYCMVPLGLQKLVLNREVFVLCP